MNGAQIILDMLGRYEVDHVFGLPGETTLDLYDEWGGQPQITYVLTRDEKNSAFMAEAYAKVSIGFEFGAKRGASFDNRSLTRLLPGL